jgi:hypothetical protein
MLLATPLLAPAAPTIPTSVGVAIIAAYALDFAKRLAVIPKVSYYTTKLNILIRVILSGIGTLGVSWAWSSAGTGHELLITIPAWSIVLAGLWHWATSYGVQHMTEIQLAQRSVAQEAMRTQKAGSPGPVEVKPMAVPVVKD